MQKKKKSHKQIQQLNNCTSSSNTCQGSKIPITHFGMIQAHRNQAKAPPTSAIFRTITSTAVLNTEADRFEFAYLSRKQRVGVKPLHLHHQVITGKSDILHKLPVEQKPVRAPVNRDSFRDPPVPQAPHVGITLQEKPIQPLFSDKPEGIQKQLLKVNHR